MAVQFSAGNGWQGSPLKTPDSKSYSTSIWFKTPDTLATQVLLNWHIASAAVSHGITITSTGDVNLTGRNESGTVVLSTLTSAHPSRPLAAATWYNLLVGVDLATATTQMYINGTAITLSDTTVTDDEMDFTVDHITLGAARNASDERISEFLGVLDEIWWDTSIIDFSAQANRDLFLGPNGEKVGLGAEGRRPLNGTRPLYFFTHGPGNFGRHDGTEPNLDAIGSTTGATGPPPAVETLSRGFKGEKWRESERSGIPFPESRLVYEPASGLEVADREWSTDRDEINRRARRRNDIFEY